jgi:hypothetical protein
MSYRGECKRQGHGASTALAWTAYAAQHLPCANIMHLFTACRLHPAAIAALLTVVFPASLPAATPVSGYTIVAELPHSTRSYTEGFFYRDGLFYEGTGLKGNSAILVIEPESGKVLQRRSLPSNTSAKGSSIGGRTFTSGHGNRTSVLYTTGFLYDRFENSPMPARAGASRVRPAKSSPATAPRLCVSAIQPRSRRCGTSR